MSVMTQDTYPFMNVEEWDDPAGDRFKVYRATQPITAFVDGNKINLTVGTGYLPNGTLPNSFFSFNETYYRSQGARPVGHGATWVTSTDKRWKIDFSGATDTTAALQAALSSLADGSTFVFNPGTYQFSTVTVAANNITIIISAGAVLNKISPWTSGLVITGTHCEVTGRGTIMGSASWDGVTDAPHYGLVYVTGNDCSVEKINLYNVPKVGIYFDDTNKINVSNVGISGNYPAAQYTGVETAHFGIAFNPGASAGANCGAVVNADVNTCVQGLFIGNYGVSGPAYGLEIVGLHVNNCHNHGIYNAGGVDQCNVTGGTFSQCQTGVVLTGAGHAINGASFYTKGTGSGQDICGVNLRNPDNCVITGCLFKGDAGNGGVVINVSNTGTGTTMNGVTITGNEIDVSNGTALAVRIGTLGTTTSCTDVIIADNIFKAPGVINNGIVSIAPSVASTCYGIKISNNLIVIRGQSHGIYCANVGMPTIEGNTIRLEYNAPSAQTLGMIVLTSVTGPQTLGNKFTVGAGFGTNVNLRAHWEQASVTDGAYGPNKHDAAAGTALASYTPYVVLNGGGAVIDDRGPGAPTYAAAPGSRWANTSGGAGTSLYVKETASTSTVWAGK